MTNQALAARQQSGTAVQPMNEEQRRFATLAQQLETRADEFKKALPAHITPEKFQRTVITAVQQNPDLLAADRRTFITSCMKAAQDGLLPDGREAALVVFNTRQKINGSWASVAQVQYMPMVYGLRKKILQSGEVLDIHASVVYWQEIEEGTFYYEEGTDRQLRHKPLLRPDFRPHDDDIAAAYSIATLKLADGSTEKVYEVMRRFEIDQVRQVSKTGALGKTDRQGNPIPPKGPWVDWFAEMAKKTVIRRHSKSLPMSGDLIDIEGAEQDRAAHSAMDMLGSEDGAQPQAIESEADTLPRGDDVDRLYDLEKGEVVDPATGEVLGDREEQDQERGGEEEAEDEQHPASAAADALIAKIDGAELVADVRIGSDDKANYDALSDELRAKVDDAMKKRRTALGKAKS